MKKYSIIAVFLFILPLYSCGNKNESQESDFENSEFFQMDKKMNDGYQVEELDIKEFSESKISGMELVSQDFLYLVDSENAFVIAIRPNDLSVVTRYSIDSLVEPTLIKYFDGQFFIIDQATNKIYQFEHLDEKPNDMITLPPLGQSTRYTDLEAIDHYLYLTVDTPTLSEATIIQIDLSSGESQQIADSFNGYIATDENDIYFLNSLVPYKSGSEEGFTTGEQSLSQLKGDTLDQLGTLLAHSTPTDFFLDEQYLYTYTAGWSGIDRYQDFKYIDTIASFDLSDHESVLKGDHKQLFLLMTYEQKLYEVKLQ